MINIRTYLSKISFPILCLVIFIVRLPPFYIYPIQSALLNTHSIARYLLLFLFGYSVWRSYVKKISSNIDNRLTFIILFYFLSQSLSVIPAINIQEFLLSYKNIVFGLLFFLVPAVLLDSKEKIEKIVKILLLSILFNILYEFLIYFQSDLIFPILNLFTYGQYWDVLFMNFQRQRFFIDIFDVTLIPFLFYYFYRNKKIGRRLGLLTVTALVSFFALLSNFRSQLIMALFSILLSFYFLIRTFLVKSIQIVFFLFILYIGYRVAIRYVGYSAWDRLVSPGAEEYGTITTRTFFWSQSVDMALSSPIFGVGLGNFYDYLPASKKLSFSVYKWRNDLSQISSSHPHSIFFGVLAETGFLGLFSLLLMLTYFLISDIKLLKKSIPIISSSVIGFWSLFIYALVNPPVTLPYLSLFWLFRAIILKSNIYYK